MPVLTKSEASDRARLLSVRSYAIELDLTRAGDVFGSSTTIRFACSEPGASSFAELRPAALHGATLNGKPVELDDNRLTLPDLQADNELVVRADMTYSHTGDGLHRHIDPTDGETYVYAQTCIDDAQRVFACFDQPDLKAPVTLAVEAPAGWTVLANGPLERADGTRREFAATPPLATYFFTVSAGPLHSIHAEHDGIALGLHCRQSLREHLEVEAEEVFTITRQGFDHYHRMFGVRYPWGSKYDQVFVPEFNLGAMENPGCVTYRDDLVFRSTVTEANREDRAATVVHEMAHMWFGDLVTFRWWDDLWLSESFADYMASRCLAESTRFTGAWTAVTLSDKNDAYVADQMPSTHPVSADVPTAAGALANLDRISYAKGCAALRQLNALIGEAAFVSGLREYFGRHAHSNATLADLLSALSNSSGRDLSSWAQVWLLEAQVNTLRPATSISPEGTYESVVLEQTAPESHPVLRPHLIKVGLYDNAGSDVIRRTSIAVEVEGPRTEIPSLAGVARASLMLVNDDDLGYVKVRLDPDSLAELPDSLPRLADPGARALVWSTLSEMVRDAELPARLYIELAASCLRTETDVSIIELLLSKTLLFANTYSPLSERKDCLRAIASTCVDRIRATTDDLQLAFARGLTSHASTTTASILRSWLTGDGDVPDDLDMDSELRWMTLKRLVVLGLADHSEITQELASDPTEKGAERAAGCRAAIPAADAKADAWRIITSDGTTGNKILEETARAFWQPEHLELTAPYVQRYFEEMPDLTARSSAWMVAKLSRSAYPTVAVEARTVELAETMLARDDLDPLLRRTAVDQTYLLRKALTAREGTSPH